MTLLIRNEEDILQANLDYHLSVGVDFFIVTDNLSIDSTPTILKGYEQRGLLYTIWEEGDNYSQAKWVTRMARLAHERFKADWVIHSDADEFWCPEGENSIKSILNQVPETYHAIKIHRHNFPPVEGKTESPFYKKMIYKSVISLNHMDEPLPAKVCHRSGHNIAIVQGNHAVLQNSIPLKEWETSKLEILHFPIRGFKQFKNKIKYGGAAYERNKELPISIGKTWRKLYGYYKDGGLRHFYDEQVLRRKDIQRLIDQGVIMADNRLARFFEQKEQEGTQVDQDNNKSVAILTRISRLEIPYLLSFVDFYVRHHRVDRIYFIVKEIDEIDEIRSYLNKKSIHYPEKVLVAPIPKGNSLWMKDNVEFVKELVQETYTYFADADEYLTFKDGICLKQYVQNCREVELFKWCFSVNDSSNPIQKGINTQCAFPENLHKCLAKTEVIHDLTDHTCLPLRLKDKIKLTGNGIEYVKYLLDEENQNPYDTNALIIHYWSRSFNDTVLKMMYQKFQALNFVVNRKYTSPQHLTDYIDNRALPIRLRMLAYKISMPRSLRLPKVHFKIDYKYETLLLESLINKKELMQLSKLYNNYKNELKKLPLVPIKAIHELYFRMPGEKVLFNESIPDIYKTSKVFCIGLFGTGVEILNSTISELGFEVANKQKHRHTLLKFFKIDKPPGQISQTNNELGQELMSLFEEHNAFSGLPVPLLYKKLDSWFPNSKFILTIRKPEKWVNTIEKHFQNKNGHLGEANRLFFKRNNFDITSFLKSYEDYLAEVLQYFKKREKDLLVVDICEGNYTIDPNAGQELSLEYNWNRLNEFLVKPTDGLKKNKTPTFIICSGRSGSTLLMKILNSVDSVMIYGEHGGFLKQIASSYFEHKNNVKLRRRIKKEKNPDEILSCKYSHFIDYAWLNWVGVDSFKENFKKFLESFFSPAQLKMTTHTHWGFKEIRYADDDRVLEMLIDIYPDAKFILLSRNPFDVIASQLVMEKWGTFEEILPLWKKQNENMADFSQRNPNNCFQISYEEVVGKNSNKLADLFHWLDLEISMDQYKVIDVKEGIWKKTRDDGLPHRAMLTHDQVEKIITTLKLNRTDIPSDIRKPNEQVVSHAYNAEERRNIFLPHFNAVYFYIPKVASTSLKSLFASLLGFDDKEKFHKISYPSVLRSELKKNNQYFKFAIVRNPYDRLVSNYFGKVKNQRNYAMKAPFKGCSFDEFIRIVCNLPDEKMDNHFKPQHTFICNEAGDLLPDFIGKYERLADDFQIIVEKAGLPQDLKLPHRAKSQRGAFQQYYSSQTRELVYQRYRQDFDLFGYSY